MGVATAIEWTDHTFNPWWGCAHVSPGCANCYAEAFAKRVGQKVWGAKGERRLFGDKHWNEPRRWNAAAEDAGKPALVFCASMADVFEEHPELDEQRERLWTLIYETPWLRWQLLTKRPENIGHMVPREWLMWFPENVWLGVTAEDQQRLDERAPILLGYNAEVRFLSCEPLLGLLDMNAYLPKPCSCPPGPAPDETPWHVAPCEAGGEAIEWVIAGGESGPKARPMSAHWPRVIRDQCEAAGVPFLFKQWGEYRPASITEPHVLVERGDGSLGAMRKVGKKEAGRLLDARTWDGFPASVDRKGDDE